MDIRQATDLALDRITASDPPVVVFSIGIPASGKSTLLRSVGAELESAPIEVDAIRRRTIALGHGADTFAQIEQQVATETATHIARGGVALIDSTNCSPEMRQRDIACYRSLGARSIGGIWIDTPLDVAIERDTKRPRAARVGAATIASMQHALHSELPTESSDFDWVIRIGD